MDLNFQHHLEGLLVFIPVSVVQAEGLVNCRALVHELDGASGVGRYVANRQQTVR